MKVGIDTFTIRELQLDPYQTVDWLHKRGFEGVQFDGFHEFGSGLDHGKMKDIREYAEANDMYSHMSIAPCNPLLTTDDLQETIVNQIIACSRAGWHELRSIMSLYDERYKHAVSWDIHIKETARFIKNLRPVLEEYGCRINIENHGETTFEVLQVVEAVGPDICGVCLDTANTLVNAEDPVLAAKRVAPYTHLTHAKDAIIYFSDHGVSRQGKAPGNGIVDFENILAILGEHNPNLPISIEDHKWIFEFNLFDRDWMDKNPDLTPYELGQYMRLVRKTEQNLASGEFPVVEAFEAIPFSEQMEARLSFGCGYLKEILNRLNLRG